MTQNIRENILEIIDLIEDKEFPARRNIADYIILLLRKFDIVGVGEIESFINQEFEKRGEQKVVSQSQIKNSINTTLKEIEEEMEEMPVSIETDVYNNTYHTIKKDDIKQLIHQKLIK